MRNHMANIVIIVLLVVVLMVQLYGFLSGNKNAFKGDSIATWVTGVATLVTSIISILIMTNQKQIMEMQVENQKKEHQPIFAVYFKNSPDHDSEEYSIVNIGEKFLKINKIKKSVFVRVIYHKIPQERVEVYLPIVGYYNVNVRTGSKTGEIEYSYGAEYLQNNKAYNKIYERALDYSREHKADQEIVFVDLFKVFIIDYEDIYNENHVVCFIDKNITTLENIEEIERNAEEHFSQEQFKIDDINLDEVLRKMVGGGSQSD